MPRIRATTVAEHVAHQEQAVFDAAIKLFVARGFDAVTIGDVAHAVGLARNSVYRYFPDKTAILMRWYRAEVAVQAMRLGALLTGTDAPAERIVRWIDAQIDYARRPEHALMTAIGRLREGLSPEDRAVLAAGHDHMLEPLRSTLGETGLRDRHLDAATDLIWGQVLTQSARELRIGDDPAGREVVASIARFLTAGR